MIKLTFPYQHLCLRFNARPCTPTLITSLILTTISIWPVDMFYVSSPFGRLPSRFMSGNFGYTNQNGGDQLSGSSSSSSASTEEEERDRFLRSSNRLSVSKTKQPSELGELGIPEQYMKVKHGVYKGNVAVYVNSQSVEAEEMTSKSTTLSTKAMTSKSTIPTVTLATSSTRRPSSKKAKTTTATIRTIKTSKASAQTRKSTRAKNMLPILRSTKRPTMNATSTRATKITSTSVKPTASSQSTVPSTEIALTTTETKSSARSWIHTTTDPTSYATSTRETKKTSTSVKPKPSTFFQSTVRSKKITSTIAETNPSTRSWVYGTKGPNINATSTREIKITLTSVKPPSSSQTTIPSTKFTSTTAETKPSSSSWKVIGATNSTSTYTPKTLSHNTPREPTATHVSLSSLKIIKFPLVATANRVFIKTVEHKAQPGNSRTKVKGIKTCRSIGDHCRRHSECCQHNCNWRIGMKCDKEL